MFFKLHHDIMLYIKNFFYPDLLMLVQNNAKYI
jgi:hypothetical protein